MQTLLACIPCSEPVQYTTTMPESYHTASSCRKPLWTSEVMIPYTFDMLQVQLLL